MQEKYAQLALENTVRLLGIDSPSGYTENAAKYVQEQFAKMGYDAKITRKGGVLIDLGGENTQDALLLEAHTDTLGGMVAQIKGNGRLRITNVGGMNANNAEAENVRVITKFSGAIDGTVQLCDASVHVNGNYSTTPRTFDTVEVVLDEDVRSAEDVRKLGIDVGDFVCFDPRSRITESGYIKSRFLDDKLSTCILLGYAKYLKEEQVQAFREYLEGYIGKNFSDVDFLYSAEVTTEEQEMQFLNDAIAAGVEGIMAFNSFDLEKEVELCAENGVYFIRPSSTTDPETFDKVADNPYFLGYFGPGREIEYEAGYDMGAYFADEQMSDSYFLLSGGAGTYVMHEQRAEGMLDALQEAYGVQFEQSSAELASASEPVSVEAGNLKVTVFPGYIGVPDVVEKAVAEFE